MSKNMATILVIEDEPRVARFLELELKHEGYDCVVATDGIAGLERAKEPGIGVVLLDIALPGMNGIDVCKELRKVSTVPVIMLTARDEISDKVLGLDAGADDYLTKPFATPELLARIRTCLLRGERMSAPIDDSDSAKSSSVCVGKLKLLPASYRVYYGDDELSLTKKEYDLLLYLCTHLNVAQTRDVLMQTVWEYDYYGDTNVVDVYVRYLRQKIDEKYGIHLISTVRGVGYMVTDDKKD
jgi:DNA-binding response OmpR family regulator